MNLLNRFTGAVLFSAEVETVKELLLAAIRAEADLREANLRDADLRGASLYGADLRGANLSEANLSGADLRGANLSGVNLYGADLYGADLRDTNLSDANLYEANLYGANLYGAYLRGANLNDANLYEANAQINGHAVIQINGLPYPILITNTHLRAGCHQHAFAGWRSMSVDQVVKMGGQQAVDFYPTLIGIIDVLCKDREAASAQEVANV